MHAIENEGGLKWAVFSSDEACMEVWLWLFFKVFFILKCIKIIFFLFLNFFLRSAYQNDPKHIKKIIFLPKNNLIFMECGLHHILK